MGYESRGSKRKANDNDDELQDLGLATPTEHPSPAPKPATPAAPRRIIALDQVVVNKIAAGEIIVAPVHALKELIENAVDAGSTQIEIVVKDGGLRLLQITDNGHGINRDDLPILCERFTTSKLQSFDDLSSIGTYGFRGEALASISHIAHLTVTTKTKDSNCAWRATYSDGKLVPAKPGQSADPKPVAGRQGTQITVEDLFYNVPSRRRAFRSSSEEYSKILDVVGRYAVHCDGVSFTCKKHGDTDMGVATVSNASIAERIRRVYGSSVANELISLQTSDKHLGFIARAMISNANYHVKRTQLLLFINHRSVESSSIKKGVEATYATFLPKGGHPFVYLSIAIEPQRVDVNVHPTKREVNFLHEDEIVDKICASIQDNLAAIDTSRSYTLTQTLLPGTTAPASSSTPKQPKNGASAAVATLGGSTSTTPKQSRKFQTKKPYENNTVRVDARDRKITSMLPQRAQHAPTTVTIAAASSSGLAESNTRENPESAEYEYDDTKNWTLINYCTVKKLRANIRDSVHNDLSELFRNHTFIGVVDDARRLAAVQHGVRLYLVDYARVAFELFYQIGLSDFGNFGAIRFNPPLPVKDILEVAAKEERDKEKVRKNNDNAGDADMEVPEDAFDWDTAIKTVESLLVNKRLMLKDYFSLEINDESELVSIPLLIKGYMPALGKLPAFLLRLGPNVDWNSEQECFDTFLRELALFYVPEPLPPPLPVPSSRLSGTPSGAVDVESGLGATAIEREIENRRRALEMAVETVLFPAVRRRLIPGKDLLNGVTEVADLKGLYRIFERSC
ncbi:DNA mismatch repair protein Mlh1 [Rhizina undulata]